MKTHIVTLSNTSGLRSENTKYKNVNAIQDTGNMKLQVFSGNVKREICRKIPVETRAAYGETSCL